MNEEIKSSDVVFEREPVSEVTLERYGTGAPYKEYRIPGVVVTNHGTLLCYYEARREILNDWAPIDLKIRRSTDEGITWSDTVLGQTSVPVLYDALTLNNPVMVVDGEIVHFFFCQNYERAYHCLSNDDGITWSEPVDITPVFDEFDVPWNVCAIGPGHGIITDDGRILVTVWLAYGILVAQRF